jgi:hypothetical protein
MYGLQSVHRRTALGSKCIIDPALNASDSALVKMMRTSMGVLYKACHIPSKPRLMAPGSGTEMTLFFLHVRALLCIVACQQMLRDA